MTTAMTTLGELIHLQRGYDLTETQRRPGSVPIVGSAGVHGYHDTARAKGPGVTLGRRGASFGKVTFVREDFWPHNTTIFVTDFKGNEPLFISYLLQSLDFSSLNSGSAQQSLNRNFVYPVPVRKFALPLQRLIAGILSAYDQLMENSQRRIRILEEMARALYREWFVNFRFPGQEKLLRVASSLGDIPHGWEVCPLGDFVQFKSGFAFKSGTFTAEGEHRLVTIRNVQDGAFNPESDSRMSELPKNLPPYCLLKDGDILLSLTGNVGRVCLVYDAPFLLNQRVSKLAPVEAFDWAMTYCMFREPEMRVKLEQLSNGVAQQNLSPVLASKMEFARAPRELRQQSATVVEPMVRRIVQLHSTIQNLRRTRDLLLPRLLSGQVELAPSNGKNTKL
ncbi:MAG TPA: restriction endonuclease subunit S [Opitutaceae bacterium]|nr:restriction endonuclease subunit S [Opitutaceae bacterium]